MNVTLHITHSGGDMLDVPLIGYTEYEVKAMMERIGAYGIVSHGAVAGHIWYLPAHYIQRIDAHIIEEPKPVPPPEPEPAPEPPAKPAVKGKRNG